MRRAESEYTQAIVCKVNHHGEVDMTGPQMMGYWTENSGEFLVQGEIGLGMKVDQLCGRYLDVCGRIRVVVDVVGNQLKTALVDHVDCAR